MSVTFKPPRGTRNSLDALAASNSLEPGAMYFIEDEARLAMALTVGSYTAYAKEGEIKKPVIPIWAEENGGLNANSYEWSWGNGSTGSVIGIPLAVPCELFAVSFNSEVAGTSITMQTQRNTSTVHTSTHTGRNSLENLATPIAFAAGDAVSFQTGALVGSWSDARVCAWFREL